MNGEKESIQYEKVQEAADTMVSCSGTMGDLFDNFRSTMATIYREDNFEGEASEALQTQFDELKKKFDSYVELVQEFSDTINYANESTHETEREIQIEAEELPH